VFLTSLQIGSKILRQSHGRFIHFYSYKSLQNADPALLRMQRVRAFDLDANFRHWEVSMVERESVPFAINILGASS